MWKSLGVIVTTVFVALVLTTKPTHGANILGIFTSHSPSHLIIHMSVVKALAEQGHNVTVVTSIKPKVTHKDITVIVIPAPPEHEKILEEEMSKMANTKNTVFSTMYRLLTTMSIMVEDQYIAVMDPRFTALYNQKFDLVIQGYFMNEFQFGVAAKFKCPLIVDWMQASMETLDLLIGNPRETSYVPTLMTPTKRGEVMNFRKRLSNFLATSFFRAINIIFNLRAESYYSKLFSNEKDFPSLAEIRRNVSLLLTASHSHSEGTIRPVVPALIEIGGIHIKEKPDPLPKDIFEFLDKSEHGAILLSLGSNVKGASIKPEINQAIFKALSTLKQRVIWKWEDLENTPGKASNILYKKWLPQDDILAHPQIKLFITHAGKGGITEAQFHAVPMVALPIFGDQPGNAEKMAESGYGVALNLLQLTEPEFKAALLEVLENPKYANNIKQFSDLYRDRPLTARQNAVYWIEYVLRHHGAAHIQSPAVHLDTIAYYNLDIYALLLFTIIVFAKLSKIIIKLIWRKVNNVKAKKATSKVKKNK